MTEPQSVTRIAHSDELLALVREVRERAQEHKRLSGIYRRQARRDRETLAFLRAFAERNGISIPHSTQPQEAESS